MEDMLGRVININDPVVYSHASQDGLTLGVVMNIKPGNGVLYRVSEVVTIKVLKRNWKGSPAPGVAGGYQLVPKNVTLYSGNNLLVLDNNSDLRQRIEDIRNA